MQTTQHIYKPSILFIMKYPNEQYSKIVDALRILKKYVSLEILNLHFLYYTVYQNYSEGQKHNKLLVNSSGQLVKAAKLDSTGQLVMQEGKRIIEDDFSFELYPSGINDAHIETAMKRAIKEALQEN